MLLSICYREHKCVAECSELVPVAEFFFENVRYVEFPRNVDNFYFFEMDTFYDVVISEAGVFLPLCCE